MAEEDPVDDSDRDWLRIGLVVCCLLAAIGAAFLMPTFASDSLADSPIDRILPGEGAETQTHTAGGFAGGDGGGLGALNPGDATGVGGEISLDSETYGTTDTELHFTIESSQPAYWRTGSFDRYTGAGWERTGEIDTLDGSIDHAGPDGAQIDFELTLEQPATAVPTPWRPSVIEGVDDPQVTDSGGIRAETPIEAGATIEGVSFAPQDDVDRLRSTSESYPEEIEQRYTQLPDDTPDRIGAHTEQVIDDAEAEGTYEKAVAIQQWLRNSKEYDLGVDERGDNIADRFIFEMDAGYCEYFATSMVAMLRSHDIPSRYVVGYSTGQQVAEDTYEVRAMNAHAWVEVYFEGVGWVTFDPTPGNDRLATQEEALEEVDGEFELGEPGSPGERFEPGESENESEQGDDDVEITLDGAVVPGESVDVTVTYEDDPVPGLEVFFNDQSVGITDEDGTVTGTVPDAEELEITLGEGDDTTPYPLEALIFGEGIEIEPGEDDDPDEDSPEDHTASLGAGGFGSAAGSLAAVENGAQEEDEESADEPSESYPIERTATLVVTDEPAPGETVTVIARVAEIELSDATVSLDGEEVGQTDDEGRIEVTLPDRTGEMELTVERDSIYGSETIEIPELSMAVETGTLGGFALGTVTVEVELDDEPAAGVPVTIEGEEVGVTNSDGETAVQLPFSSAATLTVEAGGQTEQVTVSGLLYLPAVVGALVTAVIGAVAFVFYRNQIDPRRVGRVVAETLHTVVTSVLRGLVAVATNGDQYIAAAAGRLQGSLLIATGVLTGEVKPREAVERLREWASGVRARAGMALRGLLPNEHTDDTEESTTIRNAWQRFLDSISIDGAATRTPGELATHAIEEEGLPEQAVTTLRDTFREVEYGERSPSDRLERIQEAIDQIERAQSADGGE